MTAAEVRAKFPNPQALADLDFSDDTYCVGGAACRFAIGSDDQFPNPERMSEVLGIPLWKAEAIAQANDFDSVDRAWELLDEALKGTK